MRLRVIVALSLVSMVVGCGGSKQTAEPAKEGAAPSSTADADAGGDVIATYGGKKLTSGQIVREMERLPTPSRAYLNAPERKRQFVDNMILNDLLYDEGKKAGYDTDPEVDRQVTDLRKRLVVQRVMRKYQTPPEISDEKAKAYYDENPNLYSSTQVRASHILVKDEDVAKQILAELKTNPEKFEEIAKAKSSDTASAQKGGDLGQFGQGRMVPEFERAAFSLKEGELSEIVKTQYGYHIIKVTERKEGERKPFDQVKEQIKATLRNKALQDQTQGHMDELKQQANVKLDEDALAKIAPPAPTPGQAAPAAAPGH